MTPRVRKRLFDALRIAICIAALWFVIRGVTVRDHVILADGEEVVGTVVADADPIEVLLGDGERRDIPLSSVALDEQGAPMIAYGLKTALMHSSKMLILLAMLLHLPVGVLQGIRLQWLLRAQNIHIGYWECIKFSFAGNFLNFATPLGSNAGDVFKAYFVSTHTDRKTEAITTIAMDRAIGLGTLILCVAIITLIGVGDSRLATIRPYVLTVVGLGFLFILAYFSPVLRKHLIPRRWLARLPMFEHLQRADQSAHALIASKGILAGAILTTLALQVLAIGAYFVVAVALGLDAHAGNVLAYYAYFYTGAVIQALPGPPQGLGTVELAYRFFLAPFGSPSQIVCVAFLARIVVLVVALPGLLVTMTGSYRPRSVQVDQPDAMPGTPADDSEQDLATT